MSLDATIEKAAQELVETRVRLAVAQVLTQDPRALVEKLVDAALSQRDRDSFHGETVLASAVRQLITEAARAALAEWVEENRQLIREAVRARLTGESGLVERIADRILEGLETDLHVRFTVDLG